MAGTHGRAELRDNAVYLTYDLADVQRAAYKRFVVDTSKWRRLVAHSYSIQNVIYSMIFLEGFEDDPEMVFNILFNYYAPQQFLRIFIAPEVSTWLSRMGLDPRTIGVDEVPILDSPQPRHRGVTTLGYRHALRDEYKTPTDNKELLQYLSTLGTDYLAKVLDHIRILSWGYYFAQTEDAYVYGLIKEYLRKYGHDKDFDFYRRAIHNVRLEI